MLVIKMPLNHNLFQSHQNLYLHRLKLPIKRKLNHNLLPKQMHLKSNNNKLLHNNRNQRLKIQFNERTIKKLLNQMLLKKKLLFNQLSLQRIDKMTWKKVQESQKAQKRKAQESKIVPKNLKVLKSQKVLERQKVLESQRVLENHLLDRTKRTYYNKMQLMIKMMHNLIWMMKEEMTIRFFMKVKQRSQILKSKS